MGWMRELYEDEYDFFYQDGYAHILPKIEVINGFDFVTYCRYYSKVGDRLAHLPIFIIEKDHGPSAKSFEKINEEITKITGMRTFDVESIPDKNGRKIFRTQLGLYLIYSSLSDLLYNDDKFDDILEKLFTGFYITVTPNCREGAILGENMFIDKSMYRYEDFIAHFAGDFFTHILLYHKLKRNGNNPISIRQNIIIQPSIETNENRNGKYTLAKHKKYSKFITTLLKEEGDVDIEISDNIGDCFNVVTQENPCFFLGYILFNEFILGQHLIFCYGNELWVRDAEGYPCYADSFMVNKNDLGDFIYRNQNVNCISLINHSYQDIYSKRIANLPIVKELRGKFTKKTVAVPKEVTTPSKKDEELNQGYEDEVLKEIELMRTTTDKSEITVEVRNRQVQLVRSNFQVNDISRIKEMRELTSQNGGAHIVRYDYSKRYIKGDRLKNIGGKKGKYNGNEDVD